jgi:hypothetical protein
MLRRHADRANWALVLGVCSWGFGTREQSWSAGVVAGLGFAALVYGCACYARAKGRHPAAGALLGSVWILGMILHERSPGISPLLTAAFAIAGLVGLTLLRDRHKSSRIAA